MSGSWADYLAEGSLDSETLQGLADDVSAEADVLADAGDPGVAALQSAAWDDGAAADFAADAELGAGYVANLEADAQAHLESAAIEAGGGDAADYAWQMQQAGFAADSAASWASDVAASYDTAAGYTDAADSAVADAAYDISGDIPDV